MSNDITAILQQVTPQGTARGAPRMAVQPTVVEASASAQADRVSLTDSARLLQLANAKPGESVKPQQAQADSPMVYTHSNDGIRGKGQFTTARGNTFTREVAMTFDPQSQSLSRQVSLTGQNGHELTRTTELNRTEGGFSGVTRRVGFAGNEVVRQVQVEFNAQARGADVSVTVGAAQQSGQQRLQRENPAMASMMEAFYTTSDMKDFDAASDLNSDGVINFQDLSALRAMQAKAQASQQVQQESPLTNMENAFFTSAGAEGFDETSDLNGDGMINFQDLAALRAKQTQQPADQITPVPEPVLQSMTDSFFTTESSQGFDAGSDVNNDGMINFQDLAALRAKMENSA